MLVLGIETSCDETAASVVKDGRVVLSSIVSSSLNFHKKYGGVIPEIAFRMQLETIADVVECAIKEAKANLKDIKAVSVTNTPGLSGSLAVGVSFAKSLALSRDIPLLGVNHLYGHIYASFLNRDIPGFPFISLIVSGGHTSLFLVKDFDDIVLLGSTCDDACGEAFDKVAKILNLGYPGGPIIEKMAIKGNPQKIKFTCSNTDNLLDFSFSGIKTAVLYYAQRHGLCAIGHASRHKTRGIRHKTHIADIAAAFQEAVVGVLVKKSLLACQEYKLKKLIIGGGVAANNHLRLRFDADSNSEGVECLFPTKVFCMDNAAMIAGFGYQLFKRGHRSNLYLNMEFNRNAGTPGF